MKNFKSLWVLGLGVAILLWPFGSSNLIGQEKKPVSPGLVYSDVTIPDQIKLSMNAEILRTNQVLETLIKILPGMTEDQMKLMLPIVEKAFEKTYLKNPTLVTEKDSYYGWEAIILILKEKAAKITDRDIRALSVNIEATYLPYDLEKRPGLDKDRDFKMIISTHLNLGSDDIMRGCSDHRRLCEPVDCN
jgi:hypothetical protein